MITLWTAFENVIFVFSQVIFYLSLENLFLLPVPPRNQFVILIQIQQSYVSVSILSKSSNSFKIAFLRKFRLAIIIALYNYISAEHSGWGKAAKVTSKNNTRLDYQFLYI